MACNVGDDKRFLVRLSLMDRSLAPLRLNAVRFVAVAARVVLTL